MAEFTLAEVLRATDGTMLKEEKHQFAHVVTDSRRILPGALFFALVGERFDGHAFVRQAAERGAAGVVVSTAMRDADLAEFPATVIRVPDTLQAYQALARSHRERFAIPVIAVTGSNGKTTTKDLTAAVLSGKLRALKTEANYNNEIGLPLTLLRLERSHEAAVVEMGMRGLGQIRALAEIALPTIGIVTNVSETHIELLGSVEHIAEAKGELVEALGADGTVILNADNPHVAAMRHKARGKVVTYGFGEACDVRAARIEARDAQTSFVCRCHGREREMILPMAGRHNVYNALAAIAVGAELGLSFDEMQAGLLDFVAASMRQQILNVGAYTVINDAYNASPTSMAAAIDTLAEVARGRKVAVLGDMLELGGVAVESHAKIGALLAERRVDAVVTVGVMAGHIADAARKAGVADAISCADHAGAAKALRDILKGGDTILVKGSRGMRMEKVIGLI